MIQKEIPQDAVDEEIVKKLNDGPPRIKAPAREEMKIEIKKLSSQVQKAKAGGGGGGGSGTGMNTSRANLNTS